MGKYIDESTQRRSRLHDERWRHSYFTCLPFFHSLKLPRASLPTIWGCSSSRPLMTAVKKSHRPIATTRATNALCSRKS